MVHAVAGEKFARGISRCLPWGGRVVFLQVHCSSLFFSPQQLSSSCSTVHTARRSSTLAENPWGNPWGRFHAFWHRFASRAAWSQSGPITGSWAPCLRCEQPGVCQSMKPRGSQSHLRPPGCAEMPEKSEAARQWPCGEESRARSSTHGFLMVQIEVSLLPLLVGRSNHAGLGLDRHRQTTPPQSTSSLFVRARALWNYQTSPGDAALEERYLQAIPKRCTI